MYLLYLGDIPNLVSCAFSTIPIFPPFNSQNFLFTCLCSFFTCFAVVEESIQAGALLRPKNGYLYGHVGHQVRAPHTRAHMHLGRRHRIAQLHNFYRLQYILLGQTCSKKTACLNFLCLLPMVLKTRGLGTGATLMRGSYVAEPRLLAWLRERTVLVKSEHELHHW